MALRNVIHRRNHKERSQLTHRSKLGLLEKHKDYVLRAKDHHSKRDRIKRLREKAGDRNRDEFYFGMVRGKTEGGVHVQSRGNEALPVDVVSLLKTQDSNYVRAQLIAERRRVAGLTARLAPLVPSMRFEFLEENPKRKDALREVGLLPGSQKKKDKGKGKKKAEEWDMDMDDEEEDSLAAAAGGTVGNLGKKTVWRDDVDELRTYAPASAQGAGAGPSRSAGGDGCDWSDDDDDADDLDITAEERSEDAKAQRATRKEAEKHLSKLLGELSARLHRVSALSLASSKLSLVRALMASKKGGGSVRKLPEATAAVVSGRVTANGLALPGNEDEDDEEEEGQKKKGMRKYKWSSERKR